MRRSPPSTRARCFASWSSLAPPPELLGAVEAAVELHRTTVAEQSLLEQTLHGSIKMLTEVMGITNPVSFGRAQRIKQHVSSLCDKLELGERWQVEVAAMLSQLSTFTLPAETLEKVYYGAALTPEEQAMLDRAPDVTEQLLSHIPRLETVRDILAAYPKPYKKPETELTHEQANLQRSAQILRLAVDFDTLEAQGLSSGMALTSLKGRADQYQPAILSAFLSLFGQRKEGDKIRDISVAALRSGMVLAADVKMATGTLFVARGYEITPAFLERIRNFRPGSVREPIKVLIRAA